MKKKINTREMSAVKNFPVSQVASMAAQTICQSSRNPSQRIPQTSKLIVATH
ncbi:unnamed protein product [Acidithrix sp. C25]|nr:unnamed protein product [Acidithrix sp. C25]